MKGEENSVENNHRILTGIFLLMKKSFINGRQLLFLFITLFISGCFAPAYVPVDPSGEECDLLTRKLTLEVSEKGTQLGVEGVVEVMAEVLDDCGEPECLLVIPLGILSIPVSSLIVSGSIVVGGNTIHWIEKQGKCDNGMIRKAVNNLRETTPGGRGGSHAHQW
ncbi:hypothetical protein ACFL6N_01235 [Thermodesulfobacteriota bacterium]